VRPTLPDLINFEAKDEKYINIPAQIGSY